VGKSRRDRLKWDYISIRNFAPPFMLRTDTSGLCVTIFHQLSLKTTLMPPRPMIAKWVADVNNLQSVPIKPTENNNPVMAHNLLTPIIMHCVTVGRTRWRYR